MSLSLVVFSGSVGDHIRVLHIFKIFCLFSFSKGHDRNQELAMVVNLFIAMRNETLFGHCFEWFVDFLW